MICTLSFSLFSLDEQFLVSVLIVHYISFCVLRKYTWLRFFLRLIIRHILQGKVSSRALSLYIVSFSVYVKIRFTFERRLTPGPKTTRNKFLYYSSWTKKLFSHVLIMCRMSFGFRYLNKFEFLFETNLGSASGDWVGTCGQQCQEVKIS